MKACTFAILYWLVAAAHLGGLTANLAGVEGLQMLGFITKPALMILLFIYYYMEVGFKRDARQKMILTSLAFSWSGDVNLMMPGVEGFQSFEEEFFMLGLVSFLMAHVFYILAFRKDVLASNAPGYLKRAPLTAVPILAFLGILLFILLPGMKPDMMLPVVIYAGVITIMTLFALNRYGTVSRQSFQLVFAGAVLFMLSDSMIAIGKFYTPFALSRILIMFTYITAQYLIIKGTIRPGANVSK